MSSSRSDSLASVHWSHCDQRIEVSEASRAEYVSSGGYSLGEDAPPCPRCSARMRETLAPMLGPWPPRKLRREEEEGEPILSRKEYAARARKRREQEKPEQPERTLMPWGEFIGWPMIDVPDFELNRARAYYAAKKRAERPRSREIIAAIDAALAAKHSASMDEFPRALSDELEPPAPWETKE